MAAKYSVITDEIKAALRERGVEPPPTQDELPYSDGKPLDNERHGLQMDLLFEPLRLYWRDRNDVYVGRNQFLYFSMKRVRNEHFLGPDVFVVMDVPTRERLSWVVWEEGKPPDVVIEILSSSTKRRDQPGRKQAYQDEARIPEYHWYDPDNREFSGFSLAGREYRAISPDSQGRILSDAIGLSLTVWRGTHNGVTAPWLRWALPDGTLLPTGAELAKAEHSRAEAERERADAAEQRLAAQLAELERYRTGFGPLNESAGVPIDE